MIKSSRCIALLLILALLCGMVTTAGADVVTLEISFFGRRTAGDGSEILVPLEGRFRVTQNGETVGFLDAGKGTVTLYSTERIRIEPLPETIAPEWDLSGAAQDVIPEKSGMMTITVVADLLKEDAALSTPAPAATAAPEGEDETGEQDEGTPEETDEEEPVMSSTGAVPTPTMPPYDLSSIRPTPEPEWTILMAGTGSVRVCAYYDQNNNGLLSEGESTVAGVTVCLFTENGQAVASVTTEQDGMALFENLPDGNYRIKAILPDGWAFHKKGTGEDYAGVFGSSVEGEAMSDPFSVAAGETAAPGISLARCLHVSGVCWFEDMIDGLYQNGEAGLPGVLIELNGEKNGLHYETVSDEDGSWRIERVAPALYKLTVHAPEGMMFTRAASKNGRKTIIARDGVSVASRAIDLNDKESKEGQYIGFTWAGQISGICFQDANYNGVYDEGEPPMAGVKVTAIKQAKDEEAAVTWSGEDGTFVLTGLRANTYKMRAVLPEDGSTFTKTVSDLLGNHFTARPGRRENFWKDFVLASSEQRQMNVGVIYPASVTGTVYLDNDFSATLNGSEKIVSGFLVTLLDTEGNVVTTDKTSVKGKYELTDVPPGDYTLSVTALKNYAFTKLGEGNVILNRTYGEGYSETFHLDLKEKRTGMDIGMILPGTVSGFVFADLNDNGVRDAGEEGLPGVTVRLMSDEGEAFSAEIGEDGRYLFDAVMPGTYWLEYTLPENAVFARVADGGNTITGEAAGRSEAFEMASGLQAEGPVCGALTLGWIEGSAYRDHDGNGLAEDGEEPAGGLTVTLTPSRAELDEITVTTGEDGRFRLDGLRPDEYTLTVTCSANNVISRTDSLALPLTAGRNTQSAGLSVPMGAKWIDQKIGTVIPASLSGQMWLDENDNGRFDEGEKTPAGCEITVTDDKTGRTFEVMRTDENGRFAASGMIPGDFTLYYRMDEDTIAPKDGDSDFREENGQLVLTGIRLYEDEEREGLMLGIVRYTAIAGSVWIDRGGSVEMLSGAEITLKDGEGNALRTLTTTESGTYRFDKLMPGTYQLDAVMPEGCVVIEPGDARLGGNRVSVMAETLNRTGSSDLIDLKMAEDRTKMDIGCVLPGRIGDFCWLDLDGDGLQGLDEPGIPGVKIELLRDGEPVMETVTDQYGFYRFSDLYPAAYTLRVTAPEEIRPTKRRTDIPLIVSILEETEDTVSVSAEFRVESDQPNYNVDLGFICRQEGILPPGIGEGKTQDWTGIVGSDN